MLYYHHIIATNCYLLLNHLTEKTIIDVLKLKYFLVKAENEMARLKYLRKMMYNGSTSLLFLCEKRINGDRLL